MKSGLYLMIIIFFIAAGSCTMPVSEFTEKKLVIGSKQTVRIPELDLVITNNGCGRKWMMDNGGERPYCDLVFKRKDSVLQGGGDFKPVYLGNIEITIDKINPWGMEEDSIPPGGCRVRVRKVEGR
jgi:hypothetical protein